MKTLQMVTDEIIYGATELKKMACKDGPDDILMQLDVRYGAPEGEQSRIAIIQDRDQIVPAVRILRQAGDSPAKETFVGLFSDAFFREFTDFDAARASQRGDLTAAYQAGDMTVKESLVVTVLEVATGDTLTAHIPYVYGDHGELILGEVAFQDAYGGPVIDALRASVANTPDWGQ